MRAKKDILMRNRPGTAMIELYFDGGGEVPQCLSGAYTSEIAAKKAIEAYLTKRDSSASSSR